MKKVSAALGTVLLTSLLVLVGCLDQDTGSASRYKGPLFRYHYAGQSHLPAGSNAVVYKAIDAMDLTAQLRAEVARKLAQATLPFWRKDLPPGATDQSALLRPLFDDLLVAPALVEVRGPAGRTESVLAVEVNEERAQLWDMKLRQLAAAWRLGTPQDLTVEGAKGWEVKRAQAPTTLQFFRLDRWLLLGLGQEPLKMLTPLLSQTKKSGRPLPLAPDNFLEMSLDFPGLRSWFPILARYPLPAAVASLSAQGENVRTEVKLHYRSPIPWRPEPWRIPTNFVGEPLTSFTAAQGVAPLLRALQAPLDAGVSPLPNQWYFWGVRHAQYRVYFAAPVAGDGSKVMDQVMLKLPRLVLAKVENAHGSFVTDSNRTHLVWQGLPYLMPMVHAARQGPDHFLVGGNVPVPLKQKPVPDDLFAQLRGRTNLLYYDWEITGDRFTHGRQFYQLACIATGRSLPPHDSTAARWVAAVTPKLGNSATEISYLGPHELAIVRKSHLGFTGFELASLMVWLESPGFPLDFQLPPITPWTVGNSMAARMTSAPPPNAKSPVRPATNDPAALKNTPPGKR